MTSSPMFVENFPLSEPTVTVDCDTGAGRQALRRQRPRRFVPFPPPPARRVVLDPPLPFLAAGLRVLVDRVGAAFGRSMPRASSARLRASSNLDFAQVRSSATRA